MNARRELHRGIIADAARGPKFGRVAGDSGTEVPI